MIIYLFNIQSSLSAVTMDQVLYEMLGTGFLICFFPCRSSGVMEHIGPSGLLLQDPQGVGIAGRRAVCVWVCGRCPLISACAFFL